MIILQLLVSISKHYYTEFDMEKYRQEIEDIPRRGKYTFKKFKLI